MKPLHSPYRNILFALLVISLGIFAVVLVHFVRSFFNVQTVIVMADPQIFTDTSLLREKRNLLVVSLNQLSIQFEKHYPLARKVSLTRRFPSSLIVSAEKRFPVSRISTADGFVYIDDTGRVLPPPQTVELLSSLVPIDCPVSDTTIGITMTSPQILLAAAAIPSFPQTLGEHIEKIACVTQNAIIIYLLNTEIILPVEKRLETLMSSLQLLFKQFRIEGNRPQTIDLRFEKAVILPKGFTATGSGTGNSE